MKNAFSNSTDSRKLKILYHMPYPGTVYAGRFIYEGYKNAFLQLGHSFYTLTSEDSLKMTLEEVKPDIFISSLHRYALKFLDLEILKRYRRDTGLIFFNLIPPWKKLSTQAGCSGLEDDRELVSLIKKGLAGDAFYYWIEQDSPFMYNFEKDTGYPFYTILLAADTSRYYFDYDKNFAHDVSFVGHYLKEKRRFIDKHLMPLKSKYNLGIYGLDWTIKDRIIGNIQKGGQYFNISALKGLRKLPIVDDRKVYSSTTINLNIHGDFQSKHGSDINERTFKILASGGFEICDYVATIRDYFNENELILVKNTKEWFEAIDYFIKYPDKRIPYIKAGQKKVLEKHTYVNRASQFINIYFQLTK